VKTRSHIKILFVPPRRREGLTILEMLVSTAVLAFIVLGLTAMFVQTQKAFMTGIKENTITDAARTIVDMVSTDMGQMSDGQNPNVINFYWGLTAANAANIIVNYDNNGAIRTNELEEVYILERTNTTWVGVGYAISNLLSPSGVVLGVGTLYRFETNWNNSYPSYLFYPVPSNAPDPFYSVFLEGLQPGTNYFNTNYWHPVADGVIDMKIRAFDQFGNENDTNSFAISNVFFYPIMPANNLPINATNDLPNSVELEFGILEPEALAQARSLSVNALALQHFLMSNTAPKMEVFRQRVTIAAATR
jgi:hypothetical protein